MACLFAGSPTFLSPLPSSKKATIDGVVLFPSEFGITTGSFPSITDTHEFVVPKSMPIILLITLFLIYSINRQELCQKKHMTICQLYFNKCVYVIL